MRTSLVALRKESVDRNHAAKYHRILLRVALRKESVDRNSIRSFDRTINIIVALRKESVDRNRNSQYSYFLYYGRSPQGERG